jgi:hypothetical protein
MSEIKVAVKDSDLFTSEEWQKILDNDFIVYDPDGWDRTNLQYSWFEEKITLEEYRQRVLKSTIVPKGWNK